MQTIKRFLPLLGLLLAVGGCTTTITNLTPSQQPRNATGLYPFAVAWESSQQSLRKDTLKACVMVGLDTYPMQPAPMVKNRWETLVAVPADKDIVHYRFKFDYDYLSIPARKSNSRLSTPYQLKIVEK